MKNIIYSIFFLLVVCSLMIVFFQNKKFPMINVNANSKPCFTNAEFVIQQIKDGIDFLTIKTEKENVVRNGFNYSSNYFYQDDFYSVEMSCISAYYATGDTFLLSKAKHGAEILNTYLPSTGLIPRLNINNNNIILDSSSITHTGNGFQSKVLEFACCIALVDSNYKFVCKKLADAFLDYGIDKKTNLVYNDLNTFNGTPIKNPSIGFESQLGSNSCSVVQSLVFTYKVTCEKKYLIAAVLILQNIWDRRNLETNLISESWDIINDKVGMRLYPNDNFRYDDMGGAYIRALTLAIQYTANGHLIQILNTYTKSLLNKIWDNNINGGAFRYHNSVTYRNDNSILETMYGLFIGSLLTASPYLNNSLKKEVLQKCTTHCNNVFLTNYGVKNFMIPHCVNEGGEYYNNSNDSQLGYAVIQFHYGMSLLSQFTNNPNYLYRCCQITDTLLRRHKIGNNINSPKGFVSIVETKQPYGFETNYSSPYWCNDFIYLPSYMLFSSITTSKDVKICWHKNNSIGVFGLTDMPYWDLDNVNYNYKSGLLNLTVNSLSNYGTVNLFNINRKIKEVILNGIEVNHNEYSFEVSKGIHKYTIYLGDKYTNKVN